MSKLLSQGGYGCVYHPALSCSGKTVFNKKKVSKLQKKDWAATNEIEIGKLIKKISNYHLFFLPIINSCNIDITNINKDLLSECRIIKKNPDTDFILMKMDYLENIPFSELWHKDFMAHFLLKNQDCRADVVSNHHGVITSDEHCI